MNFNKKSSEALIQLEKRISDLETKENSFSQNSDKDQEFLIIKEVTFRIGTEDDRLRIYWSDGRKTDLPCTKEQNIWACG